MRQWLLGSLIVALLGVVVVGLAGADRPAPDRAAALEARLRCPTCKTVSIAESPSTTAADMRQVVAEQVAAGRSDAEIVDYFRQRYGDWVLLDPPLQGSTLLLWMLPVVVAAAAVVAVVARTRRPPDVLAELPEPDRRRVARALAEYRQRPDPEDEP